MSKQIFLRLMSGVFLGVFAKALPAQIVNIEELRITNTNDSTHWYGNVRAAANLTRIQNSILFLQGEGRVQYRKEQHIVLFVLNSQLIRTEKQDFNNAHFVHLRYTGKWADVWAWESFFQLQQNRLVLLQGRQLAGLGLRQRLFKSGLKKNRAYAGQSIFWESNQFIGDNGRADWWRLSMYLSNTFRLKNGISLVGTTYWQPVVGHIKNYRFSTEWALNLPFTRKFAFVSDVTFWIDHSLPDVTVRDFYIWKNGITFSF